MRTSHSAHVKFHATFLFALIITHLKCCFIQIRVHPLLRARHYSSCQEQEHWHANLTGHDRMFLASQRQQIEAVHEATSLSWPRGIFYYRTFLYLGFLQALLLDVTGYLAKYSKGGQHLFGLARTHRRFIYFACGIAT